MTENKTENEMIHDYLQRTWYQYDCADTEQIDKIIKEELRKTHNNTPLAEKMLKIKRRCIQECQ